VTGDSTHPVLDQAGIYCACIGVGGIGSGMFFALEGDHTLGRNESRPGRLLDVRDYCKLHIIAHYVALLLGADPSGSPIAVLPVGKVGRDLTGQRLVEEMRGVGMDTRFIREGETLPTMFSICFQYPDGAGGNITTSRSAGSTLSIEDVNRALTSTAALAKPFIALAAPEVPLEIRTYFLREASRHGAFRAAAFTSAEMPAAGESGILACVDLLTMNEDEAGALTGLPPEKHGHMELLRAAGDLLTPLNREICIIVTAGRKGAAALHRGSADLCPAVEVEVASTAGAGDALMGGMIAGLAAGMPLVSGGPPRSRISERPLASAFEFACLLAGFTVTSPHTIHPGADLVSLLEFAGRQGITFADGLIRRACRGTA
jgi:sugar/nucleoside kinase (ribokinase family)